MFLLRKENSVIGNIAAINTKQHGGANNEKNEKTEKIKLETLVRYVGANHQAIIIHIIINVFGFRHSMVKVPQVSFLKQLFDQLFTD